MILIFNYFILFSNTLLKLFRMPAHREITEFISGQGFRADHRYGYRSWHAGLKRTGRTWSDPEIVTVHKGCLVFAHEVFLRDCKYRFLILPGIYGSEDTGGHVCFFRFGKRPGYRRKWWEIQGERAVRSIPDYGQARYLFKMSVAGDDLPIITKGYCSDHFIEIPDRSASDAQCPRNPAENFVHRLVNR